MNFRKTLIITLAVLAGFAAPLTAETARQIMERHDALPDGDSFRRSSVLLVVKSGRNEKKEFVTLSKEYDRKWRSSTSFTYPSRMGFLVWDEPGVDSQQWIKLTSGKVRKIASSEKGKPWMNSHFSNQDIAHNYIEDHEYSLLGEEEVNGTVCYKIRAEKVRGERVYSHTVIYIGKEDDLRHRVEFYENGRHTKTLDFANYETIDGVATPRKMIMSRTDGQGKSILYTKEVHYGVDVDDRNLTREAF